MLNRYGGSLGKKLLWLLDYFISYEDTSTMPISYHPARGIEMACSLDLMVARAGGNKETWRRAITTLCMLGLLRQYKPRKSEWDCNLNTPAQAYSVARMTGNKRYPVTWYSVPEYTEAVLARANELASIALKYSGGIDKDGMRYELGAREANRICDTGYSKGKWRVEMEQAIYEAIKAQIGERGYTTLAEVLEAAQRRTGRDRSELLATWKSYRHELNEQSGVQYGRPTAQQKDAFHLESDKWIITKEK